MLKWLWLSVLVVVLDQISKVIADSVLTLYQQQSVIEGFFNITLAYNTGAAFSFLSDAGGWQRWFFTAIAAVASVVIIIMMRNLKSHERITAIALALILGGAIGNVIDRVIYGHVIDFIQVYYKQYYWPTFNLADSFILIGAAFLITHGIVGDKSRIEREVQKKQAPKK